VNRPVVEVVGLGPGGDEYVTRHTLDRIEANPTRILRTNQHPSAHLVRTEKSFDHVYDTAADFEAVYSTIVDELVTLAHEHGRVLYAVPGSPLVLERTVYALLADERVETIVHPAMGFLDLVWSRLRVDPIDANVTLVDAHEFAARAAGLAGPLLVAHCHANWVMSEVKLAAEDTIDATNDDARVIVLHHLGLPDERVVETTWAEIDRVVEADHLTSLYVPQLAAPVGRELVDFHELARRLRRECPWDREQTHRTLITYLLEETYEVVDALLALDPDDPATDEHLAEELGDLLYQIEFHAAIAEQDGRFTMADVARGINDKLVRRHPHVFAKSDESGSTRDVGTTRDGGAALDDLVGDWERIKRAEKEAKGVVDGPFAGVPTASGALSYASAVLKRAAKAGHAQPTRPPSDLSADEDLGLFLLAVVDECRRRGIDPEVELRRVVTDVRTAVERRIGEAGNG